LAICYNYCIAIADKYRLQSIAFCCISTGEFAFPNERAAQIAVNSVLKYKTDTKSNIKVVFNVFKDLDYEIYSRLLGANK
ncbi:MAG: macro domain-containing protein, partial [Clostridia bacterium]|nr:macro domain-containing protein [Clostridia bacterium]